MKSNEYTETRSAKDYIEIGAALIKGLEDGLKLSSEQEIKPWEKNNPTLGKSSKYSQEKYNPSIIRVNRCHRGKK